MLSGRNHDTLALENQVTARDPYPKIDSKAAYPNRSLV
jgi:hypothetical protein